MLELGEPGFSPGFFKALLNIIDFLKTECYNITKRKTEHMLCSIGTIIGILEVAENDFNDQRLCESGITHKTACRLSAQRAE